MGKDEDTEWSSGVLEHWSDAWSHHGAREVDPVLGDCRFYFNPVGPVLSRPTTPALLYSSTPFGGFADVAFLLPNHVPSCKVFP